MTVGDIKEYCKDQVRLVNHSMIHALVSSLVKTDLLTYGILLLFSSLTDRLF